MAGVKGVLTTEGPIATTTSPKTILQLAAADNHRLQMGTFSCSFAGTTPNDGRILVELLFQTSAGTMSAATVQKRNPSDTETLQAVGQKNATGEPTSGGIIRQYYIDPEWGYTEINRDISDIQIPGGSPVSRLGLRVTAGTSINMVAFMDYEE